MIEVVCRSFVERGSLAIVCLRPTLIVRPEREAAILAQLDLDDPDADPPGGAGSDDDDRPYGALSLLRGYARSADTARCFRLALDYEAARFDAFNVAAVDGIGHERLLPRVERAYGRVPEVRPAAHYDENPYASVFDCSRARELLGWEPRGDWNSLAAEHRITEQKEDRP